MFCKLGRIVWHASCTLLSFIWGELAGIGLLLSACFRLGTALVHTIKATRAGHEEISPEPSRE
jgi:hypothetical protein